jgi:hypothetical protein
LASCSRDLEFTADVGEVAALLGARLEADIKDIEQGAVDFLAADNDACCTMAVVGTVAPYLAHDLFNIRLCLITFRCSPPAERIHLSPPVRVLAHCVPHK